MNTRDKRKSNSSKKTSGQKPVQHTNTKGTQVRTAKPSADRADRRRQTAKRRRMQEERKKRQLLYLLQGVFLGLCIALLLFSIWKLASIFLGYRSGDKEYEELREQYVLEEPISPEEVEITPPSEEGDTEEEPAALVPMTRIDLASLQSLNSEAVGWIEIPGTVLSYPMVHTTDNSYYLNHTFRKENNKSGSIFIETSNKEDFSDLHTIIYGHNMKDGSMFAGLKNYTSEEYYKSNPYIYVDLADGAHCYEIFSCHEADVTDISYTIGYAADEIYASFLDTLKVSSLYDTGVEAGIEDSVITLSTCTSSGKNRFVVHAKKLY
ncbi:MAG: class B sortase [Clostridiales bacterium]|nr:class B sortase [Clostridiales bacterium]